MSARISSLLLAVTLMLIQHSGTGQPEPNRAGLVVVHGDGTIVKRCVEFSEESITGAEVLQRAGLQPIVSAYGGLGYSICAIDGEGCAAGEDCFCQCRKSPCSYWVYSHRQQDGTWAISGVGASTWVLRSGDIDGWVWGHGTETPPQVRFEDVCPAEAKGVVASAGSATVQSPTAAAQLPSRVEPARNANESAGTESEAAGQPVGNLKPWNYALYGLIVVALASGLLLARGRGS